MTSTRFDQITIASSRAGTTPVFSTISPPHTLAREAARHGLMRQARWPASPVLRDTPAPTSGDAPLGCDPVATSSPARIRL